MAITEVFGGECPTTCTQQLHLHAYLHTHMATCNSKQCHHCYKYFQHTNKWCMLGQTFCGHLGVCVRVYVLFSSRVVVLCQQLTCGQEAGGVHIVWVPLWANIAVCLAHSLDGWGDQLQFLLLFSFCLCTEFRTGKTQLSHTLCGESARSGIPHVQWLHSTVYRQHKFMLCAIVRGELQLIFLWTFMSQVCIFSNMYFNDIHIFS